MGYTITTAMNTGVQKALENTFRNPALFPPDSATRQVEAAFAAVMNKAASGRP